MTNVWHANNEDQRATSDFLFFSKIVTQFTVASCDNNRTCFKIPLRHLNKAKSYHLKRAHDEFVSVLINQYIIAVYFCMRFPNDVIAVVLISIEPAMTNNLGINMIIYFDFSEGILFVSMQQSSIVIWSFFMYGEWNFPNKVFFIRLHPHYTRFSTTLDGTSVPIRF